MTFNSHKRSDTQSDVIQHRAQSSALSAFDQALLFQRPMIHLNPPRTLGLGFPLSFSHCSQIRRPVFRCVVCGANPKYPDFSKTFEPQNCAVTARQSGFRNCLQTAAADSDLPIGFQPRQKMPTQRATQFQVVNRRIPTVEANKLRIKSTLESLKQHILKVIVLGFPVAVFIKHAIIYRNATLAIGPEQRDQINAAYDLFSLARPMPVNKGVSLRIRFFQCRIVENRNAGVQINLRFRLLPKRPGIGFESLQKPGKSVVRGSIFAIRLDTPGFGYF